MTPSSPRAAASQAENASSILVARSIVLPDQDSYLLMAASVKPQLAVRRDQVLQYQ